VEQLPLVLTALDVLLAEYQRVRPQLTTLGIAHERPSVTRRLLDKIARGVNERLSEGGDPIEGGVP
jgi:hypothetical protein